MELILQMKDLWELVTEKEPKDQDKLDKWNKKDMNARATLLWQISPGCSRFKNNKSNMGNFTNNV